MAPALDDPAPGDELPPLSRHVSFDRMRVFSGYPQTESIHTDEAFARSRGLDAPVVQGLQLYAFACQALAAAFGTSWFTTGELAVSFVRVAVADDTVTVGGTVTAVDRTAEDRTAEDRTVSLDVRCEDQHGTTLLAGTASVILPGAARPGGRPPPRPGRASPG